MAFGDLRANREPSTLIASHPELQWMTGQPEIKVPIVERPDCYEIVVVGGAAGRSMYFYGAHEMITKPIDPA
jgi:hypothetical protein